MPWNKNNYPDSWKNLNSDVRNKAIEIGNALLRDEDYEESRVIAIATEQAKKTMQGEDNQTEYHITKHDDGWQLKQKGKDRAIFVESTKKDLEEKAKPYVTKHDGILVVYKADGSEDHTLYEK
ncbi:DUF2188 domain-containing protein [Jeotgalibacillus sp. S-D1]|uniref:DUF2188 domain-containing protein n=1 Tax=Jeotgalibacillus sp. S-D1 TaxID=2552189 RepID=UPI0010596A6C|nr:DUF2188 domain-containing protein [Jeotgalibacillus sp. S-D1]TDL30383.1 DUF2188 domain-containing protein [Jeotgalibacillus sp. S-D1]